MLLVKLSVQTNMIFMIVPCICAAFRLTFSPGAEPASAGLCGSPNGLEPQPGVLNDAVARAGWLASDSAIRQRLQKLSQIPEKPILERLSSLVFVLRSGVASKGVIVGPVQTRDGARLPKHSCLTH